MMHLAGRILDMRRGLPGDPDNMAKAIGRVLDELDRLKLRDETQKLLGLPELDVTMTCVRVPVEVGHSASILIETATPLSAHEAQQVLREFPGIRLIADPRKAPTPRCVSGSDEVWVGRVREELSGAGIWLWEVSDNLRKGAATNAVQTAEAMIARGLLG